MVLVTGLSEEKNPTTAKKSYRTQGSIMSRDDPSVMNLKILFCVFRFEHSHAQYIKNRKCVGQGPEGGHENQTPYYVLLIQKGGAQPEKMD